MKAQTELAKHSVSKAQKLEQLNDWLSENTNERYGCTFKIPCFAIIPSDSLYACFNQENITIPIPASVLGNDPNKQWQDYLQPNPLPSTFIDYLKQQQQQIKGWRINNFTLHASTLTL